MVGEPYKGSSQLIWSIIPGTKKPNEIIGFGACHHETVPICPGANDNASGQSILLELGRFLSANSQDRSILLLSNEGEKGGLLGSGAFVDDNKDWLAKSLKAMIMADQVGGIEPLVFRDH